MSSVHNITSSHIKKREPKKHFAKLSQSSSFWLLIRIHEIQSVQEIPLTTLQLILMNELNPMGLDRGEFFSLSSELRKKTGAWLVARGFEGPKD